MKTEIVRLVKKPTGGHWIDKHEIKSGYMYIEFITKVGRRIRVQVDEGTHGLIISTPNHYLAVYPESSNKIQVHNIQWDIFLRQKQADDKWWARQIRESKRRKKHGKKS